MIGSDLGPGTGPRTDTVTVIKKLPFKESVLKNDSVSEEEKRINFFKGPLPLSNTQQIIIAIPIVKKDVNDDPFVLAIMTKI
jgi:hypothetical protein